MAIRPLHLVAVIVGSLEIVLFAGVIFGWHSIVYVYKDEGYFAVCTALNKTQTSSDLTNHSISIQSTDTAVYNFTVSTKPTVNDQSCEERFRRHQESGSQSVCAEQDNKFNLIFTLATVINGLLSVFNGYLYDRFGTRFCRIVMILCYLCGLSFNIAASAERPGLLFPGFILTTYGGYLILMTNLQLAGLIPHLRSMLMSLYSGSYDTSSGMFLLFKLLHESGFRVNYSFLIQGILFCLIIISSTFLIHKKTRLPWPLPPDYVLTLNKCKTKTSSYTDQSKHAVDDQSNNADSDPGWKLNENGSMINLKYQKKPLMTVNVGSKDDINNYETVISEGEKVTADLLEIKRHDREQGQDTRTESDFRKVVFSPLYLFDLLWMCLQRLRSWFFVGMFNPWITRMACGDKSVVSHYTSFYASVQFLGILTAPMSGRLMDRKIKCAHKYSNPKHERLHASIASFVLNITVSVVFSITTAIPVIEVQYLTCILHSLHRSFLYGPNSAFIANAFPAEHFGKLFGISLTVSAIFGMLQYPLFLLIQGPLDNDPLVVNILFITLMLVSYVHPAYIWYYLQKKPKNQNEIAVEMNSFSAQS